MPRFHRPGQESPFSQIDWLTFYPPGWTGWLKVQSGEIEKEGEERIQ